MNAYCPECETELDVTTGICPACRWDPLIARTISAAPPRNEEKVDYFSLTERYRGTSYDISVQQAAVGDQISRGRVFVVVGLIAGVVLYGGVISAMGIF
jgi:hypothetical protein